MNKKGFTLIEMLAVIAIIAVLVAIIVPAVGSSTTKAKASTDAANLRSALSSATIQYANTGSVTAADINVPAAKSTTANSVVIALDGDNLVAYYVNSTSYYTVHDFATVATNGGTVSATGTAPDASDVLATINCG